MENGKLLLEKIKTYNKEKNVIENYYVLEYGSGMINSLKENERFNKYLNHVAQKFKARDIRFKTIPSVYAGAVLFEEYEEMLEDYNFDQISLLACSCYMACDDKDLHSYVPMMFHIFTTPIMNEICDKSRKFDEQFGYMQVVEFILMRIFQTKDEIANYIRTTDKEVLDKMALEIVPTPEELEKISMIGRI